jgi:hypothetical protein
VDPGFRSSGRGIPRATVAAEHAGDAFSAAGLTRPSQAWPSGHENNSGLILEHACGTCDPMGVVARAIRGRSRGFGWRGGATAAKPAGVCIWTPKGRYGLRELAQKGERGVLLPRVGMGWCGCAGWSATRSSGGSRVALAEEGAAGVLRASGSRGSTREAPAGMLGGSGVFVVAGAEQLLEEPITCGGGSAAKSGTARTKSGKSRPRELLEVKVKQLHCSRGARRRRSSTAAAERGALHGGVVLGRRGSAGCLKGKAGDLGEACPGVIPAMIAGGPLLRGREGRGKEERADRWARELSKRGGVPSECTVSAAGADVRAQKRSG